MARETIRQIMSDAPAGARDVRKVDHNTVTYTRENGERALRLHHTDIIVWHDDGSMTLDTRGWQTVTTKDRLNKHARPFRFYSDRGAWWITKGADFDNAVPFYDGIRVHPDEPLPRDGFDAAQEAKALRRKIGKFVCLIPDDGALPQPSGGDCWYCAMRDASGKSWGDASGDTGHLRSHIDEGYMFGSLIANALQWAGYRDPAFIFHHGPRDLVRRAVRRYLVAQLGLAR